MKIDLNIKQFFKILWVTNYWFRNRLPFFWSNNSYKSNINSVQHKPTPNHFHLGTAMRNSRGWF